MAGGACSPWGAKSWTRLSDRTDLLSAEPSLLAKMVKNPPAMQETWVLSLGWEDSLEKGKATHSRLLGWRISMDRGAQSMGS